MTSEGVVSEQTQKRNHEIFIPVVAPEPTLLYRGEVESYEERRGYGFVVIRALLREQDERFDYNWLEPINRKALVHFKDVKTDCNIRRPDSAYTVLARGQIVYFKLTLNDKGSYQAIELISEIQVAHSNESIGVASKDKRQRRS